MNTRSLRGLAVGIAVLGGAAPGEASGVEIAVYAGPAHATYKQTLTFGGGSPRLTGLAFQSRQVSVGKPPALDADAGTSFGVGATFLVSEAVGIEARVDSVDVDLQTFGGDYTLEAIPFFGFPAQLISLGAAETNLRRVYPLSVNLRFQSPGRVGIGASAGLSYVSAPELDADSTTTARNRETSIPVSFVATTANAAQRGHLGLNGGITLKIKVAAGLAIVLEGRAFVFKRSELKWDARSTGSLEDGERALLDAVAAQLELPKFSPAFWTARAGIAFRF